MQYLGIILATMFEIAKGSTVVCRRTVTNGGTREGEVTEFLKCARLSGFNGVRVQLHWLLSGNGHDVELEIRRNAGPWEVIAESVGDRHHVEIRQSPFDVGDVDEIAFRMVGARYRNNCPRRIRPCRLNWSVKVSVDRFPPSPPSVNCETNGVTGYWQFSGLIPFPRTVTFSTSRSLTEAQESQVGWSNGVSVSASAGIRIPLIGASFEVSTTAEFSRSTSQMISSVLSRSEERTTTDGPFSGALYQWYARIDDTCNGPNGPSTVGMESFQITEGPEPCCLPAFFLDWRDPHGPCRDGSPCMCSAAVCSRGTGRSTQPAGRRLSEASANGSLWDIPPPISYFHWNASSEDDIGGEHMNIMNVTSASDRCDSDRLWYPWVIGVSSGALAVTLLYCAVSVCVKHRQSLLLRDSAMETPGLAHHDVSSKVSRRTDNI